MTSLMQTTTTRGDVNPPDPTGQLALGRTVKSADESEMHDSERDDMNRADADRSRIARAIARRQSMPNGEWGIRNPEELRNALQTFRNPPDADKPLSLVYGPSEIQRHIIARARELQLVGLLPPEWGVSQETLPQRQKRLMLQAIEDKFDNAFLMTCEQIEALSRDETSDFYAGATGEQLLQGRFFSAKIRRKYASQGVALPDGSFPIPDKDALRRAIRLVGKGGAAAKRHIIKRARALGALASLPPKWGVGGAKSATAETAVENSLVAEATSLCWTVHFDGTDIPYPTLLQGDEAGQEGFTRIRAPFYIGDSITRPPGISKKVKFPTRILQETVLEGNKQIKEGKQPLTVYSRHSRALSGDDLPIGGIVKLTAEGRIGYVYIDITDKGEGQQVIGLLQHKPPLLNAVSLRSTGRDRFELDDLSLGDEDIYEVKKLLLDGVDFAPDSPAQQTYGIQVLTAEAERENTQINSKKEVKLSLTLETLRSEHPALVDELTGPLSDEIATLHQEIASRDRTIGEYKERERKNALDAYVKELADMLPEAQRAEGLKLFQEFALEEKTKEAFSARVLPTFTRLLATGAAVDEKPSDEERFLKLFPNRGGNGIVNGITQEKTTVGGTEDETEDGEMVGPLAVPA